jgi:hypothetical protein
MPRHLRLAVVCLALASAPSAAAAQSCDRDCLSGFIGRTVTAGPQQPWTWEIAELFKVEKGLAPYGMGSGSSTWEQAMSTDPRTY